MFTAVLTQRRICPANFSDNARIFSPFFYPYFSLASELVLFAHLYNLSEICILSCLGIHFVYNEICERYRYNIPVLYNGGFPLLWSAQSVICDPWSFPTLHALHVFLYTLHIYLSIVNFVCILCVLCIPCTLCNPCILCILCHRYKFSFCLTVIDSILLRGERGCSEMATAFVMSSSLTPGPGS